MSYFTQLNPSIPLITPKGSSEAIGILDYGPEHDIIWICIQDNTGELWSWPNSKVKGFRNVTLGRDSSNEPKP